MTSDTLSKRSDVIAEEAAEFFIALRVPDIEVNSQFIDWLKVSPEHVNEFLAVAALWDDLPQVSGELSAEELIRLAGGDLNLVALREPQQIQGESTTVGSILNERAGLARDRTAGGQPLRSRATWLGGQRTGRFGIAAAAAFVAISVGWFMPHLLPLLDPNIYTTAIGEQTSVSLADGSIVTLNTQSTMRVQYSKVSRVVHLTRGEALFDVAKDPDRVFRVITGSAVIQAVGTQFNVRSVAEDVTITVVEGIVDISARGPQPSASNLGKVPGVGNSSKGAAAIGPVRLTVGQQARIESQSGQVAVIRAPAVEKAIAWQQRWLVFEHLSLREVIDEFNRYNDPPIVIEDPELHSLPISGVFRSNDPESFVQLLSQMKLAEPQTRIDGTVVLRSTGKY